ncbi:MAG: hypothetical protein VX764_09060 [Planctomycetota bacterium]|nr:hypothetical protein [Planctomycetota bacterium]
MELEKSGKRIATVSLIMMGLCFVPFFVMMIPGVLPHGNNGLGFVFLAFGGAALFGSTAAIGALFMSIGTAARIAADKDSDQATVTADPPITRFGKMVFNASGITFFVCMLLMLFWADGPDQIKVVSKYSFRGILLGILIRTIGAIWETLKKRWLRDTPAIETDLPYEPHDPPYEPDNLHDK